VLDDAFERRIGSVGIAQKVAVQLKQNTLGHAEIRPRGLDRLHHLGVAGDFLLVAGLERFFPQAAYEFLDFAITELRAFDARRGSGAFNGRDAPQRMEDPRPDPSERTPLALELVVVRWVQPVGGVPRGMEPNGANPMATPRQFAVLDC
jgi:hypothetical protein